ncbi:MAG: tetraacyldisaccharide 4'-kinase, partial [Gammaproteobacteria bacterium]
MRVRQWVEREWQHLGLLATILAPLSLLFRIAVALRRFGYRLGVFPVYRAPCPVIVVGNLTVGGSGKTPLVIWLANWLREQGYRPGIVARGYGGRARHWPQQVRADSDPGTVGDEAVVLARRTGAPVCVGPARGAATAALLAHTDCDVVISDDGLQHYALARDVEVAVVNGETRFGNGLMLPAGPLREPRSRLRRVDMVVSNGDPLPGSYAMRLRKPILVHLHRDQERREIDMLHGKRVCAIAGIANPERFFHMLRRYGLEVEGVAFPDHHPYRRDELAF